MTAEMQRKAIRKATREVAKEYKKRVREIIPKDTGAMANAVEVRSVTRTIKGGTGKWKTATRSDGEEYQFEVKRTVGKEYGAKAQITRKSLERASSKTDRPITFGSDDEYFYPALVELGGVGRTADGSMRRQIRAMRVFAVQEFRKHLAEFIRSQSFYNRSKERLSGFFSGKKK